jgi:1-acyl-sn-glycerol-3-phosphate acyltransferase
MNLQTKNIDRLKSGGCLVLANHPTLIDAVILIALIENPNGIIKSRLFNNPSMYGLAKIAGLIRNVEGPELIRKAIESISKGDNLIIFPEGTRTPRGSTKPYRKGGARLASATGALVIPIAHNAGSVWPKNSFLKYPGTVILSIGPPITSTGKSGEELQQEVEAWIEAEMRVIDPSAY